MTKIGEHDQKFHINERQPSNFTENINFGPIHTLRFVVFMILFHIGKLDLHLQQWDSNWLRPVLTGHTGVINIVLLL